MLISCFYLKERRGGPGSAASTARAVLTRWGTARAKPRPRTATPIGFWGQKAVFWQTQGVGDNEAGGSQGCRAGGPHEHPSQPWHRRHAGGSQHAPRGDFGNAAPPTLAKKMGAEQGNHYPAPAMKQYLQNAPGAAAERRLPQTRGARLLIKTINKEHGDE